MAWDLETEPELEEKLAWMRTFGSIPTFLVVMCGINPDVHPYQGWTMIIDQAAVSS